METKLNKLIILLFVFHSFYAYSQEAKLSKINIEDVSINNLKRLDLNPQENLITTKFGKPINKITIPPQPEWDNGGLQLIFKNNTEFYYSKQGDNYYLEKINLNSEDFKLIIKSDTIAIGDNIEKISNLYKESYEYFKLQNLKPYKKKTQDFNLTIINLKNGHYYATILKIRFTDDTITSIYINLLEGN